MFFHQRFVPGLSIASYIAGDAGECAVIDPTRDIEDFMDLARKNDLHIRHIIETHIHADFVSGALELKERTGASIYCSGMGGADWRQDLADHLVSETDTIEMGSLRLGFLHTPGHTPEHIIVTLTDLSRAEEPWLAMTGDFLFVGDVGRPDLLGEEEKKALARSLHKSVFEKLPSFSDYVEIWPGHGAGSLCGKALSSRRSSTIGFERKYNPALQHEEENAWLSALMKDMPLSPPYFLRMKKVNLEGPRILGHELPGLHRRSVAEVHGRACEDCLILDVRGQDAFAASHIPGSINIPLGPNFPTWCGWMLPYNRPLLAVLNDPEDMNEVATHLVRVGFDDIHGYLEGGMDAWEVSGYELASLSMISVHTLKKKLDANEPLTVLDVRTSQEWDHGHIDGALYIHVGQLQDRISEIPRDKPVAVICGSGYRASIASSFLLREGLEETMNVTGGMSAWQGANYKITDI